MEQYKNAHKWLIIPFVITVVAFFPSYYMRFTDAHWGLHIHGISATLWYMLVIYQPYLIQKKNIQRHRLFGMFGLFLAGLVAASALTMIPGNIAGAERQLTSGDISPIAPPFFLYGVSLYDLIAILGFSVSVMMAIKHAKSLHDHVMWMISTVFWVFMPALARLALFPMFASGNITHFANLAMIVTPLILLSILVIMYRLKSYHPALIAAFAGNLLSYIIVPLGMSKWWVAFATILFTSK